MILYKQKVGLSWLFQYFVMKFKKAFKDVMVKKIKLERITYTYNTIKRA